MSNERFQGHVSARLRKPPNTVMTHLTTGTRHPWAQFLPVTSECLAKDQINMREILLFDRRIVVAGDFLLMSELFQKCQSTHLVFEVQLGPLHLAPVRIDESLVTRRQLLMVILPQRPLEILRVLQ